KKQGLQQDDGRRTGDSSCVRHRRRQELQDDDAIVGETGRDQRHEHAMETRRACRRTTLRHCRIRFLATTSSTTACLLDVVTWQQWQQYRRQTSRERYARGLPAARMAVKRVRPLPYSPRIIRRLIAICRATCGRKSSVRSSPSSTITRPLMIDRSTCCGAQKTSVLSGSWVAPA